MPRVCALVSDNCWPTKHQRIAKHTRDSKVMLRAVSILALGDSEFYSTAARGQNGLAYKTSHARYNVKNTHHCVNSDAHAGNHATPYAAPQRTAQVEAKNNVLAECTS